MTNMGILHDTYGDLKHNFLGTKNVKCGDKIGKIKILLLQQQKNKINHGMLHIKTKNYFFTKSNFLRG